MSYKDREPDFENESFRAWISTEEEKNQKYDGLEVECDGIKFSLGGFILCEKDNKKQFAYKFKHDDKIILYYLFEENKEVELALHLLKSVGELGGYNIQDMKENIKNIMLEEGTIKRLTKIKEKEKKKR